jgi:DNA-binding CsgD family transcriptional regulator
MAGGNLYTKEELNIVMDPDVTAKEAAKRTGRSIGSVSAKRHSMGYVSNRVAKTSNKNDIFPYSNTNTEPIPSWPYNMLIKAYIIDGTEPLSDKQLSGLEKAMECFTEREALAVKLYFKEEMTLDEVGKEMGITRERVRQVIARALRKLRHPTRQNLIVYGEDFRNLNSYLKHLYEVKNEIEELEAYIEDHKDTYTELVKEDASFCMNDISIDELDLSVRSFNALKRKGIKWASDAAKLVNSGEIVKVRNLGRKSYLEIAEKLKEKGFNVEVTA